jgi:hypothetical protein
MVLGLSLATFTLLHVIISLIGIASGIVVVLAMLGGRKLAGWTGLFLLTTVLTSVTGFLFPFTRFGPPHAVGIVSLAVLAPTLAAVYLFRLGGSWRWIYVTGSVAALYLNAFVGVVQAFQKISFLNPLAPTQSAEPAFVIAQGLVLALFVAAGFVAAKRFHPAAPASPHSAPATI